ncbi:MAG: QacE family quaternary ammonium compound efflux SMR transporter [Rhodoferax sp.]|nr:QacE family quaternary ammonium compound efflux SMR transporter [Rhodoferax sp.]MBP7492264.1 QacE family quaternary ammonium compound efflux SMR transporter [Rhodoferax sp.]
MKLTYLYLAVAIVAEVIATSFLKSSDGFTKLLPSAITVLGYAISFTFLSLTLRVLPIGVAYAIWSGVGVVLIATVGWLWHGQTLDAPALLGLGLIVSGVIVVNLFSKTVSH